MPYPYNFAADPSKESAPARYRGLMISVFQFWTSIGTFIGTIIDNATHHMDNKNSYMIPLGMIYIIPVLMSIGLFFIPESPRWLIYKDRVEQGRQSLIWMRPHPEGVPEEMADIQAAIVAEKELAKSASLLDTVRNPINRRRTLLAVAAISIQAASGAMFMIAYGTYFFEMAKIGNAFQNSCIITAIGVAVITINSCVISKIGRRRVFLMGGMFICGVSQFAIAAIYHVHPGTVSTGKVCLLLLLQLVEHFKGSICANLVQAVLGLSIVYIMGYNGMVSTYAWLAGGEIPSQRLRSYTFGIATSIGFAGAWLATFTAPYFINPSSLNWGPEYGMSPSHVQFPYHSANIWFLGWIWGPSCLITVVWIYIFLPEIKNRTLEEIDEMFEAQLPARKFRKYVCTGRVAEGNTLGRRSTEEAVWTNEKAVAEATIHIE